MEYVFRGQGQCRHPLFCGVVGLCEGGGGTAQRVRWANMPESVMSVAVKKVRESILPGMPDRFRLTRA
jgi:hypothetical protein